MEKKKKKISKFLISIANFFSEFFIQIPLIRILVAISFHLASFNARLRKPQLLLSHRHGFAIRNSIRISSCDGPDIFGVSEDGINNEF